MKGEWEGIGGEGREEGAMSVADDKVTHVTPRPEEMAEYRRNKMLISVGVARKGLWP